MFAQAADRLQAGETVRLRPTGNSMTPIIRGRQAVTLAPVDPGALRKGDIVLAKVGGRFLLHKITALRPDRVQISNNHGHVNGWTSRDQVYGITIAVEGSALTSDAEGD